MCEVSHKSGLECQEIQDCIPRVTRDKVEHCSLDNIITHHHQLALQILDNLSGIQRSQERDNETRPGDLYQEIVEGASGHLRISDMARQTKEDFPQ